MRRRNIRKLEDAVWGRIDVDMLAINQHPDEPDWYVVEVEVTYGGDRFANPRFCVPCNSQTQTVVRRIEEEIAKSLE